MRVPAALAPSILCALCARPARCHCTPLTFALCALLTGPKLAFFYSFGILDVREDDSVCDAFGAFVTVLFGAFDAVLVCSFESFLNILIVL